MGKLGGPANKVDGTVLPQNITLWTLCMSNTPYFSNPGFSLDALYV
jgi:hypothetical protein